VKEKHILHLTLHRRYFAEIANGIKKIEFREKKPYWRHRLFKHNWDEIHFRNGYSKDCPFMRVEFKGMEDYHDLYCIRLGKVLEVKNYPNAKR